MHSHLNQINYPLYTTQHNAKAVSARKFVEFEKVTIAEKIHNNRIFDTKKAAFKRLLSHLMVPKAGLEPARISTVDFESTASTDFATSALKGMRKRCGLYLSRAAMQATTR